MFINSNYSIVFNSLIQNLMYKYFLTSIKNKLEWCKLSSYLTDINI